MSTIKLNKPPADSEEAPKRSKPVRRASPTLRDRTQPPPKPVPKVVEKAPPADRQNARTEKPGRQDRSRHEHKPGDKPYARKDARNAPGRESRNDSQHNARKEYSSDRPVRRDDSVPRRPIPPTDPDAQPRLSKVMADRGLCSRREADDWIVNGWVKVNGEIIEALGTRIDADAEIIISTYAKEYQAENVTILLHKPVGYVSGQAEDGYEPAVVLVKPENQWSEDPTQKTFHRGIFHGLAPAGRLDIDSTGLLVLTQDGRIARVLIGDDSSVEKEYLVRVEGELSASGMAKLNHGLSLDGVQLKPAKVSWQNEDQLRFVLREGRKRQIRRMCELVGLKVVGLKRIRIGRISLGKLPAGQWRYLGEHEKF
ncbi:MAG TPA: rRNA pseudouridine synthase [Methylophilus sp.]|uniref:pseudouridine synthase n=1 Tax=Methylophilus sp. TaxID=29541 RepID=UPI002B6F57E8|nr:rRNA pseudouridine synthase [Methylophilus sp.]HSH86921.1 rRNA pseudouridine synthase [Methylophilus sp.]